MNHAPTGGSLSPIDLSFFKTKKATVRRSNRNISVIFWAGLYWQDILAFEDPRDSHDIGVTPSLLSSLSFCIFVPNTTLQMQINIFPFSHCSPNNPRISFGDSFYAGPDRLSEKESGEAGKFLYHQG